MNDHAIKLFGTEEPALESRVLRAGPVTATLENGMLRWISLGDIEVIRAVSFLIRDRNWSTCNPEISDLKIEESDGGFVVRFDALCRTADGDLPWQAVFEGRSDGTIHCEGVARPNSDFLTCRTGFVILHPLEPFVGQPAEILHTDSSLEKMQVPLFIDPMQCFMDVRSITHEPVAGIRATIRMEGDTWEGEDHRNWTDASFKTYVRPLGLPWPYTLPGGAEVRQSVTLSFEGDLAQAPAGSHDGVRVALGAEAGLLPAIGLGVLPEHAEIALEAAELVRTLGPQHLNCRLDMRDDGWAGLLSRYRELGKTTGAEVVLEAIIPCEDAPARELQRLGEAVRDSDLEPAAVVPTPALDLISISPGMPWPECPPWEEILGGARTAFPNVRLGGGMLANFTELNRKRPPSHLLDFVTHATSSLVHAADDRSLMETLESIAHIINSTRAIIGADKPYRIGPSHIGNSYNPYGTSHTPNPDNLRVTMARVEPRHRALFGAAWHAGYISQAAVGGLEAVTMASPAGEFGVTYRRMDWPQPWFDANPDARVFPVYHVLRGLAGAAGRRRVEANSSDTGRVRCVAYRSAGGTTVWLANLRDQPIEVTLEGSPGGDGSYWCLDEDSFESAAKDPHHGTTGERFNGDTLTLKPFATAWVSWQ